MSEVSGALYKNSTESQLVKSGVGKLYQIIINSHTSGTIEITDGLEDGAFATSTLTSSGAMVPASHAISEIVVSGAIVPASHVATRLTVTDVVPGATVTVGSITYTAVANIVGGGSAYQVAIDGSDSNFVYNLSCAISGITRIPGLGDAHYGQGTVKSSQFAALPGVAIGLGDNVMVMLGRVPGTSLNAVATTSTGGTCVWSDTTAGGGANDSEPGVTTAGATVTIGDKTYTVVTRLSEVTLGDDGLWLVDPIVNQVCYIRDDEETGSVPQMLDNLKDAINGYYSSMGVNYSTGTSTHNTIVATTNSDTTQVIRARTPGTADNTTATTTTLANTAWADTTIGGGTGNSNPGVTTAGATFEIGGVTYTAVTELSETLTYATQFPNQQTWPVPSNQILWVTSEAVFLDNIKKAINDSGIGGTDYSSTLVENPYVVATTNSNTAQVIQAKYKGSASNSITTTETMANYAWTGTNLTGGTGTTGRTICTTTTIESGPQIIPFVVGVDFVNGLYITVGGTIDYTVLYV